jgi:uncharacterized phage-associated protein
MITFNPTKYVDLMTACIHYGAGDDGKITKTKLAKLMYLADFVSYADTLKSISGAHYKKLERGPVPLEYFDTLQFLNAIEVISIQKKGAAEMISLNTAGPSAYKNLSSTEISTIKKICEKWQNKSTKEIVDFTHKQLPWKISQEMEDIPYSLILQEENVY